MTATRGTALRIVYIWDADYPWDVRTEKVCAALTDAGHDVHIVARNRKRQPTSEQLREGMVHRMEPLRFVGSRLDDALGFPAFFSPRWWNLIATTAREVQADLIIVRDLPLCPTAIAVARKLNVPVILDMAENYPAMMEDIWTAGRHRVTDYVVRNPAFTRAVERWCIKSVDHILTVVDASSDRLVRLGVPPDRLTVVSNTPPAHRTEVVLDHAPRTAGKVRVVYLGLLEVPRGINEVIDAIQILHESGHDEFEALIIGGGRDEHVFRERSRERGISDDAIQFTGKLPHDQALAEVAHADIGLIPHHATESWNTTIPNKLFDYMAAGLPVVSSDAVPCSEIICETGAGRVFKWGDASGLASAILEASAPEARRRMGAAGRDAVRNTYNWETDSARLLRAVEHVWRGLKEN